uniref:DUF148 domain-containing protein n=1 Tax=Steinernema glaseri TaxID=37863 RepID=A0A1I7Y9U3_9BILA
MQVIVAFLLAAVVYANAQDANSLANYVHSNVASFFQPDELVKIQKAVANQACNGATVQQIFDNMDQTVQQSVGGPTAANALALVQKLKNDLGDRFDTVRDEASNTASIFAVSITQYCGYGVDSVLSRANNYANQQFSQKVFDATYQAIAGPNYNDWSICRRDLDSAVYFSNYGY